MRIALISTDYPPQRTSAAVQMRDLAREMVQQGHEPVVIVPTVQLAGRWSNDVVDGVQVLRLASPTTRDAGYLKRTLAEFILPFVMMRNMRSSPLQATRWDLVAWYSPTIFFGPFIWWLKRKSSCRTYLILRDIFPEWALDLGLLRKGPAYAFFKAAAGLQYAMADTIGVQTHSNLKYMARWASVPGRHLEVLQNWQREIPNSGASIKIIETPLAGRKILVYVGNMGVAQGMDIFIDLAQQLEHRNDLGFLFVGRGSEVTRLSAEVAQRGLTNTLFFGEIDSSEMPGLLAQCQIGLLALDPRHRTHNIPGKFLTYLLAGLPILARVNPGTDLVRLIEDEGVGRVFVGDAVTELRDMAETLADSPQERRGQSERGRALAKRMFSPTTAVHQIIAANANAITSIAGTASART